MKINRRKFQTLDNPAYSGSQELLDSESNLIAYSTDIVRMFYKRADLHRQFELRSGKILEFGSGTGFLAEIFRAEFGLEPDCIEIDPKLISKIEKKGFHCFQSIDERSHDYAFIYTSNVLEHIPDDQKTLNDLYSALESGGTLGVYVPAHELLFSQMDEEVGHVRRYSKLELEQKLKNAGFLIQSSSYADSLGFLATLIVKFLGYKKSGNLGSAKSLQMYDKYIFPISKLLDNLGLRFMLGKNIIVIAKKD
jgi:SAM-dependent methyltransferase